MSLPRHTPRRLLGLASDRPGAGKTTAADYLVAKYGFQTISIGAIVKNELDSMLHVHGFQYQEHLKEDYRPALSWWTEFRIKYTSENYWLEEAMRSYSGQDLLIIPDLRYPNEADYVKSHSGIAIKIDRPNIERSALKSEVALDSYVFDYTVDNSRDDGGAAMFQALDEIIKIAID